jgi:hypothetical protein
MEKRNSLRSVRETGAALSRGRGTGGAVADLMDTLGITEGRRAETQRTPRRKRREHGALKECVVLCGLPVLCGEKGVRDSPEVEY